MTDQELNEKIVNAKGGNKDDFTDIVNYFKNDWFRVAKSRLLSEDDAMDAVQESIISIYLSLSKLKKVEVFKPWSIKILINKCNTIYSKNKYRNELMRDYKTQSVEEYNDEMFLEDNIENILRLLNPDERTLITMFYVDGYTSKEISKLFGININSVKTRLFRAKNKLRKYIELKGDESICG